MLNKTFVSLWQPDAGHTLCDAARHLCLNKRSVTQRRNDAKVRRELSVATEFACANFLRRNAGQTTVPLWKWMQDNLFVMPAGICV